MSTMIQTTNDKLLSINSVCIEKIDFPLIGKYEINIRNMHSGESEDYIKFNNSEKRDKIYNYIRQYLTYNYPILDLIYVIEKGNGEYKKECEINKNDE